MVLQEDTEDSMGGPCKQWESLIQRIPLPRIRKKTLKFLGHIIKKDGLENLTLTGYIEGQRDRGRQRFAYITKLAE